MNRSILFFLFVCWVSFITAVPIRLAKVGNQDFKNLSFPYEWKLEPIDSYEKIDEIPDSKITSYHLICLQKEMSSFSERERIRLYLDQGGVVLGDMDVNSPFFISNIRIKAPIDWIKSKLGNIDIYKAGKGFWINRKSSLQLSTEEIQVLVSCLDECAGKKIGLPDSLSLEASLEIPFQQMAFYGDKIIGVRNKKLGIYSYAQKAPMNGIVDLNFQGFSLLRESNQTIKDVKFLQVCPYTRNIVIGCSDSTSSWFYITNIEDFLNDRFNLSKIECPNSEHFLIDKVFFYEGKMFSFMKKNDNGRGKIYIYDFIYSEWIYKIERDRRENIFYSVPDNINLDSIKFQYIKDPEGSQSSRLGIFYNVVEGASAEHHMQILAVKSEGPLFPQISTRSTPPMVSLRLSSKLYDDRAIMGNKGSEATFPKVWFEYKDQDKKVDLEDLDTVEGTHINFPINTDVTQWKKEHTSAIADYWYSQYVVKSFRFSTDKIYSCFVTSHGMIFIVVDQKYIFALAHKSDDEELLQLFYQYDLDGNQLIGKPIERNGKVIFLAQDSNGVKEICFPSDLKNIELILGKGNLPENKSIKLIQDKNEFFIRSNMLNSKKDGVILNLLRSLGKEPYINKPFKIKDKSDDEEFKIDLIKERRILLDTPLIGNITRIGEDLYFFYKEGDQLRFCVNEPKNIIDENLTQGWEKAEMIRKGKSLLLFWDNKVNIYSKQKWMGVSDEKGIAFWNSYGKVEQKELFQGLGSVSQMVQHPSNPSEVWALDKINCTLNSIDINPSTSQVLKKFEVKQKIPYWSSSSPPYLNHPLDFQLSEDSKGPQFLVLDSESKRIVELQQRKNKLFLEKVSSSSFLLGRDLEGVSISRVTYGNQPLWVLGLKGIKSEILLYDPIKGRTLFISEIKIKVKNQQSLTKKMEEIRKVSSYSVSQKEIRLMITDKENIYELKCNAPDFGSLFKSENWTYSWHWDDANYRSKDLFFATRYFNGDIGISGCWERDSQLRESAFLVLNKEGNAKKDYILVEGKKITNVYPYIY